MILRLTIGVLTGLIITRVMHRFVSAYPAKQSFLKSAPQCSSCHAPHHWLQRIPLIGLILTLGNCQKCHQRFPMSYIVLDFLSPLFITWVVVNLEPLRAFELILVFMAFFSIALIDLKYWLIPNRLLLLIVAAALLDASGHWHSSWQQLGTAVGIFIYFGLIMLIQKFYLKSKGLGMGDLKFAMVVGLWLGPVLSVYSLFAATVLALLYWLVYGLHSGIKMDRRIQFGPFIALSGLIMGIGRALDPHFVTTILTWKF